MASIFLTYAAVYGVKPRLLEVSRLLGMGPLERVRKIVLPASLPGIFIGLRIAIGAALIVAVTVEIAANPIGLGHAMMQAEERLRPDLVFAYLFWGGIRGLACECWSAASAATSLGTGSLASWTPNMTRRLLFFLASCCVATAIVLAWHHVSYYRLISPIFLPPPERVWASLVFNF